MSATVATPRVVLVGPPRLRRREVMTVVSGANGGSWQDWTARLAAQCAPGLFEPCGCPKSRCQCGMVQCGVLGSPPANPPYGGTGDTSTSTPVTATTPTPHLAMIAATRPPAGMVPGPHQRVADDCRRGRWVPITVSNNLEVAPGGTGLVTFQPQAPFKLARITLSATQADDFTSITIAVGPTQNILPGPVDGTYFSVASNQDGDGRIDSPIATQGQTIAVTFSSTAGVAAGGARFTLQGAYAGNLDPMY